MTTSIQRHVQTAACLTLLLVSGAGASAQAPFQNLDFEAARNVPAPGTYMSAADALPYWTLYIGTNRQSQALYDGVPGLWDNAALPGFYPPPGFVSGHYAVSLEGYGGGYGSYPGGFQPVSIAQTGEVPVGTRSIQFNLMGIVAVTFDGVEAPEYQLTWEGGYWLCRAEFTQFAGQTGELKITANVTPAALDSIVFSTEPIPEPGMLSLCILGALTVGTRALNRRRLTSAANKPVQATAG